MAQPRKKLRKQAKTKFSKRKAVTWCKNRSKLSSPPYSSPSTSSPIEPKSKATTDQFIKLNVSHEVIDCLLEGTELEKESENNILQSQVNIIIKLQKAELEHQTTNSEMELIKEECEGQQSDEYEKLLETPDFIDSLVENNEGDIQCEPLSSSVVEQPKPQDAEKKSSEEICGYPQLILQDEDTDAEMDVEMANETFYADLLNHHDAIDTLLENSKFLDSEDCSIIFKSQIEIINILDEITFPQSNACPMQIDETNIPKKRKGSKEINTEKRGNRGWSTVFQSMVSATNRITSVINSIPDTSMDELSIEMMSSISL